MAEPDGCSGAVLLDRVRGGDRSAAVLMMQRHNRTLWRIARGILRDDADAEDAVQDAYLRAFTTASGFRADAGLRTWLARIVIHEALRRLQRRQPATDLAALEDHAGGEEAMQAIAPTPEQAAAHREIRRIVEAAVDRLPPAFRIVFILRVLEQMTTEETAAALAVPEPTVKTRLHRANMLLRDALGSEFAAIFDTAFPFAGASCARLTASVLARLPPPIAARGPP